MITVYSKPNCVQCTATERKLTDQGRNFRKIDVTDNEAAMNFVTGMGYLSVPVVVVGFEHETMGGQHWNGYRPDLLSAL